MKKKTLDCSWIVNQSTNY